MFDKSEFLKQIRKHAKNFSSAIAPPKEIDQKSINHALALIDLFERETKYGSCKLSIKIPSYLKALRLEENLDLLRTNSHKNEPLDLSLSMNFKNKKKKNKHKFKQAEKKLLKLLSTKNC